MFLILDIIFNKMGCMCHKNPVVKKMEKTSTNNISYDKSMSMGKSLSGKNDSKKSDLLKVRYSLFIKRKERNVLENYLVLEKIGKGGTGSVYRVIHLDSNQLRAMKVIKKENLISHFEDNNFLKEIELLKSVDHPNIIKIFEYYEDDFYFYIVTEYISGGDLYETISKWKDYTESRAATIFYQILCAVNYLHSTLKIIHRDIKAENILVVKNQNLSKINVKLIDFGAGNFIQSDKKLSHRIGTPYYIAPEVLNKNYNEKADLWSCGVLLYMLLIGKFPFYGKHLKDIYAAVLKGKYDNESEQWNKLSMEAKDLITKLLEFDCNLRISAKDALNHPFFKNVMDSNDQEGNKRLSDALRNIKNFNVREKFHQAILSYIVHYLVSTEELEDLEKVFCQLDRNCAGRLSYDDVILGCEKVFSRNYSESEIEELIVALDHDKNGYIEYEEFLRAALNKKILISKQNLHKAFDRFDLNKDGKLTVNELKEVFETDDIEVVNELILIVDKNKDGEISYEEFYNAMKELVENRKGNLDFIRKKKSRSDLNRNFSMINEDDENLKKLKRYSNCTTIDRIGKLNIEKESFDLEKKENEKSSLDSESNLF